MMRPMKAMVAALVLALQAQPVLGAAVCLWANGNAEQQCHSHEAAGSDPRVAEAQPPAAGCLASLLCAPSAPVIPGTLTEFRGFDQIAGRAPATPFQPLLNGPTGPPAPPPRA